MTFGAESDETTSHQILDQYHEAGGRFIDTADVYSRGASEQIIGRWLATRSDTEDTLIATKARFAMGEGPDMQGASAAYLERALDASLERLGVDSIDLYQIHAWDPAVLVEETLTALSSFVERGKVRAVGLSNFTGWQLERAIQISHYEQLAVPVSLQPQYNLLAREIELEIYPVVLEHGLGLLPWSPLGGGWLTGKYSRSTTPEGQTRLGEDPTRGVEAYDRRNNDRTWRVLDLVGAIADRRGVRMSQVALNWVRRRPSVSSVLLGCRSVSQLQDNLAALSWDLEQEEMDTLNRVSAPGIPDYIEGFLAEMAGVEVWDRLSTTRSDTNPQA